MGKQPEPPMDAAPLGGEGRPLHVRLRDWLLDIIHRSEEGQRLPTEYELADRFAISRLTVHKVMNELQRSGHVVRRRAKGTFVAGRDQRVWRHLPRGRNGTVIIAYADWFSYDFWSKVEHAERLAAARDVNLVNLKVTRHTGYGGLEPLLEEMDDTRGIIVVPPGGGVTAADLQWLDGLGVPVAVLTPVQGLERTEHVYSVCQDYLEMGRRDVLALAARRATSVSYVVAEPWNRGTERVLAGMRQGLKEAGMPARALRVTERRIRSWEDSVAQSYRLTAGFLRRRGIGGLVYDSVPTALGGLRAVWEHGSFQAVRDLNMAVNAGYFGMEKSIWPPVTVVASDLGAMVERAMDIVLEPSVATSREHLIPVTVRFCGTDA